MPAHAGKTQAQHRNEVVLSGRLAAPAALRTLPSGDVLASFRLVVSRGRSPGAAAGAGRPRATVDTIDCVCWDQRLHGEFAGWVPGDVVEVEGSLRRRFWRSGAGPASRSEVEVLRALRLRVASSDGGRTVAGEEHGEGEHASSEERTHSD